MSSIVALFLFLSPCLFTPHSAVNRSHSAEAFLSVCVGLWLQLPHDGGEGMVCQGQNCALISVCQRTARLTLVPFTPEASWHYSCVCMCCVLRHVFCCPFSSTAKARYPRPRIQYIQTLSSPSLLHMGQSYVASRRREKKKDGGVGWRVVLNMSIPPGFVRLL